MSLDPIQATDDHSLDEDDGSGFWSDTTSLSDSILNYRYENGRRYNNYKPEAYHMPNDEPEQDRLDRWHHIELMVLQGNITHIPLESPKKILDLGTGTGLWAMDAADKWPEAEVKGVDLSAIQPRFVPPNCHFEVDDIERDWMYPKNHFDIIHCRYMIGSVSSWESLFKKAFTRLAPGGYLEVGEQELRMYSKTKVPDIVNQYFNEFETFCTKVGKEITGIKDFGKTLEAVGFENVEMKVYHLPVGRWPKNPRLRDIGSYTANAHADGFEAYGLAFYTSVQGWSADDARVFFDKLKASLSKKNLLYSLRYNFVARKPCA